jgi:hypothetical protein
MDRLLMNASYKRRLAAMSTTLRLGNHHPDRKSVTGNRAIFDYTRSLMRKNAEPGYFVETRARES